jgi:hypothetical protein
VPFLCHPPSGAVSEYQLPYIGLNDMSNHAALSGNGLAAHRIIFPVALLLALCGSSVGQQYFPEAAFDKQKKSNDFAVEWYSQQLKALQEPSLWETSKNIKGQVYRFLWLRSFHHPVVVRLNVNDDATGDLVTKVADGHGGYPPGKLIENRTQRLSKQQTQSFLDEVKELKYWDLPTREEENPKDVHLDGAQWIVVKRNRARGLDQSNLLPAALIQHSSALPAHRFGL